MLTQIRCFLRNKKGQGTAEYAILIGLVIGAIVVMQVYIKRSLQGKVKDAADVITAQDGTVGTKELATTSQYEPYYLAREQQTTVDKDVSEKKVEQGGAATTSASREITQKSVVQYRYDQDNKEPR